MASLAIVFPCRYMLKIESFESLGLIFVPSSGDLDFLFFDLHDFLCLVFLGDSYHFL